MTISVTNQAFIFLYSVLGGMAIAFIYDVFRIKRRKVRTGSIIINIEDFIYWIIVALIMFAVVYQSNDGEIRGYIFIGIAIGVILYSLVLSKLIMNIFLKIIDIIVKIVRFVWRIITYPFIILYKILAVPGRFARKLMKRLLRTAKRTGKSTYSRLGVYSRRLKHRRKKI